MLDFTIGCGKVNCPSGQEKVPWGATSAHRLSTICTLPNRRGGQWPPLQRPIITKLLTPTLRNLSHLDTCILRQLLLSYKDVRSD